MCTVLFYLLASILPFSVFGSQVEQAVIAPPPIILPPTMNPVFVPVKHSQPSLHDLLTIESSTSIFFSYARETHISQLFPNHDARTTLLVPTNKAVMALSRKPHQGPVVTAEAMITDEQSQKNVERWISAHIIPQSPITLSSPHTYPTLLDGRSITISPVESNPKLPEWRRVLINDHIHIVGMKEASNGVLYIIDSTISVS